MNIILKVSTLPVNVEFTLTVCNINDKLEQVTKNDSFFLNYDNVNRDIRIKGHF